MKKIVFTDHALLQVHRRVITEKHVREIIQNPGQIVETMPDRVIMQSRILSGESKKEFLVRVFAAI
jgi:hypothetical protein